LTSSSPLRDENSFRKTAMSRREDILSSIDVKIMDRSANTARPSSYSKTLPAFRAGAAVTHAAGLGGQCFVDLIEPHACGSALVLQHGSECAPARIEHRLRLSSLCKRGGIHVPDEDGTVGFHQASAQFVQEILPAVRDLGVHRSDRFLFSHPLRACQCWLEIAVKALDLDRRHIDLTERHKALQSPINSHARHRAIQDRSSARIISLASTPLFAGHADIEIPSPGEVDLVSAIANRSHLQRSPAQGPSRTAALAPGEADFSMLPATPGVFLSNLLHGLHGKMQGTIAARYTLEKRSEIESGEKPPVALKHFGRQFVAVVVDGVDSAGQPREPSGVLVFHPHAKNPYRGRSRDVYLYSGSRYHPVKYWIMRKIEEHAMHAASSLTGIKTSVSRGVV
jgi:hypothetical protein